MRVAKGSNYITHLTILSAIQLLFSYALHIFIYNIDKIFSNSNKINSITQVFIVFLLYMLICSIPSAIFALIVYLFGEKNSRNFIMFSHSATIFLPYIAIFSALTRMAIDENKPFFEWLLITILLSALYILPGMRLPIWIGEWFYPGSTVYESKSYGPYPSSNEGNSGVDNTNSGNSDNSLNLRHYDSSGELSGTSEKRKGAYGEYVQNYNPSGHLTGTSEKRKGAFGEYIQNYDSSNHLAGTSEKRKGAYGEYTQHYDQNGKPNGTSEKKKGAFGEYIQHYDQNGKPTGTTEL